MNIIPLMQQGFASNSKRLTKISENFSGDEVFFRPYDKVNHFAWEVGHLAFVRNTIIKLLNPSEKLESIDNERLIFAPGTPLQPNEMFPPINESVAIFQKRGDRIIELLTNLTQEQWDSESPFKLPFGTTVGIQIWTFFLHESSHLGEISYLKNIMLRTKG
ncbi:MAG: DinB family protein [Arcicella sp.]|nr:DinB family protein [Arcicella sp.]